MTVRVSTHGSIEQLLLQMQNQTSTVTDLQGQISSGIRLSKPSVNPFDFVTVQADKAQADRLAIYQANVSSMTGTLDAGVSALQDVNSLLTTARSIAIQGADSTTDAEGDAALATEADALIQRLIDVSNTRFDGRYLF